MILRRAVFLLMALAFVSGCARFQTDVSGREPEILYNDFRTSHGECNATGIKSKASLYYTSEGSGHRTTMTLWGNLQSELRLDVRAGIGTYIAHIREDDAGLTAFYPAQDTAYSHSSPLRAVQLLGLPFPFSLKDLAGLVSGCYLSLIPQRYDNVVYNSSKATLTYFFTEGPVTSITLNNQGLAEAITGGKSDPWRMEMTSYELDSSGRMQPDKITFYIGKGDKAVLRIKSRQYFTGKWQAESLEMQLPEGVDIIRLDEGGYAKSY